MTRTSAARAILLYAASPLVAAALLLAMAIGAIAAPPPGADLTSPRHAWFERQHSVGGMWCCKISDGYLLSDSEWRWGAAGYDVRIEGAWMPVPEDAIRDPAGGPNDTGHAIVWRTGQQIICFAPGTLY
jgi:hypothetical protein